MTSDEIVQRIKKCLQAIEQGRPRDPLPLLMDLYCYELGSLRPLVDLQLGIVLTNCRDFDEAEFILLTAMRTKSIPESLRASFHIALGRVQDGTGQLEEAVNSYRAALEIYGRICSDDSTFALEHAMAWNNLGKVLHTCGQHEESEKCYRHVLHICEGCPEEQTSYFESEKAMAFNNLGSLLRGRGRLHEAENSFRASLNVYERLAKRSPRSAEPNQAGVLNNLGNVLAVTARYEESESVHRLALQIRLRIYADDPAAFEADLSMSFHNLGVVLNRRGVFEESEACFRSALEIRQRLAEQNTRANGRNLAETLNGLGNLLKDRERFEESLSVHRAAVDVTTQLASFEPRASVSIFALTLNHLGIALIHVGAVASAQDEFNRSLKLVEQVLRSQSTWGDQKEALGIRHMALVFLSELSEIPEAAWGLSNRARNTFLYAMRADYLPDLSETDRAEISRLRNRIRLLEEQLSQLAASPNVDPDQVAAYSAIQRERADLDHQIGLLLSAVMGSMDGPAS